MLCKFPDTIRYVTIPYNPTLNNNHIALSHYIVKRYIEWLVLHHNTLRVVGEWLWRRRNVRPCNERWRATNRCSTMMMMSHVTPHRLLPSSAECVRLTIRSNQLNRCHRIKMNEAHCLWRAPAWVDLGHALSLGVARTTACCQDVVGASKEVGDWTRCSDTPPLLLIHPSDLY